VARGGNGLPKVSLGLAMPYPSMPYRWATPETALRPFQGWHTYRAETYRTCRTYRTRLFILNLHIQRRNGRTCSPPFPSLHIQPLYSTAGGRTLGSISITGRAARGHHLPLWTPHAVRGAYAYDAKWQNL
jgi:hypothetical protein